MAIILAAVAGYLDGIGFLRLNGFFVSFMSGNSTRLGVGVGDEDTAPAILAGAIILLFLAGVVIGSLAGRVAGRRFRLAVLLVESLLLLGAALLQGCGQDRPALAAIILATGVENSVFQRRGIVTTGLTYMTGALVKTGQQLAGALVGEAPFAWVPSLLLWAGFVTGAALGGAAYRWIGLQALWAAFAAVATLASAEAITSASAPRREGQDGTC